MAAKKGRKIRRLSAEEKKRIAKNMMEGYKKMADLNLEIAEEGIKSDDEASK